MRICWLGPVSDPTGYGYASQLHVRSLKAAGAQIVCRPVKFSIGTAKLHPSITDLVTSKLDGYDAVVQHMLPHTFAYCGEMGLNVGLFYPETSPLPPNWAMECWEMDVLASSCSQHVKELASAVARPIELIPIPCDTDKYLKSYVPPPEVREFKDQGFFVFYTIGELVQRKNHEGLLRAFYAEFGEDEPVRLLVKTSVQGMNEDGVFQSFSNLCRKVRGGVGASQNDRRVGAITRRMTDDEIMGLHAGADVFVAPSFAEGWGIPQFDSMAMGKTPIVTDAGGPAEFVTGEVGYPLPARREPVYGEHQDYGGLYSGRQTWDAPDLLALRRAMREAFEDSAGRRRKADNGLDQADRFNLLKTGRHTVEVLSRHVKTSRS